MIKSGLLKLTGLILSLLLLHSPALATDYTADADCMGAWLMEVDEDPITDSSGEANHGTLTAADNPDFASASPPNVGSSGYYDFDGSDKIDCTNINMASWAGVSCLAWINYDSSGGNEHTIASCWNTGDGSILFRIEPADDTVENHVLVQHNTQDYLKTTLTVKINDWSHIALTWNATDGTQCYIEGVLDAGSGGPGGPNIDPSGTAPNFQLGAQGNGDWLNGSMDDVGLFDRGLNITEVNDIIDNGLDGSWGVAPPTGYGQVIGIMIR